MGQHADILMQRLEAILLALPGTSFERVGPHAAMRIGKKNIGWFMNDHHGDGVIGFACKVLPGEAASLLNDRTHFYRPAYTPKGWVGYRLDTRKVDWEEVRDLVEGSFRLLAPAKLVKALDQHQSNGGSVPHKKVARTTESGSG